MGFREQLREPAGIAAAIVIGALCAAVTAARAPAPWLAVPIGLGIAGLVLLVKVGLGLLAERPSRQVPAPAVEPPPVESSEAVRRARDLLGRANRAAARIQEQAMAVADREWVLDADQAVTWTARVVDGVYRHASLVGRSEDPAEAGAAVQTALEGMEVGVRQLEEMVAQTDSTGGPAVAKLLDDLEEVHRNLEQTEATARTQLTTSSPPSPE